MKKNLLRTMLLTMAFVFGASWSWAADPDLTNDYTLVKSAEWGDGTNIAGSGACAYTAYDTGNKKQQSLTILTAPEAAAGWIAMQAWTDGSGKGWWNRADKGLYCVNAGRSACVFGDDLTTGWLVVFECTASASSVMTLTNGAGDPDGTFSYVASEDGQKYFCTITAAENAYVGFCGNKNAGFISKISVYKPNKAVVLTTYTVNYVDMDGNTLKESVTYDAVGGADIALSDADKANITVGDDTYVYDSDDTEGKTVAEDGSSVVTVKFHKAQNFNYIVNEMCGGTAARVTKSFSYETATVTAPYRKYNAVDGQLYTKGATSKEYNYRFTLTQDNQVENIDYEAVSGVDNVVFLTEGEDIEGLTPCNSANTGIRSSNSASAFAEADTKIVTLSPGTYKLHAIIYDASKTPDSHWIFKAGETEIADFNCTTVNIQEFDSEEFTLTENTDIIMAAAGSNTMGLDALYITGTGSAIAVTNKIVSLVPGPWAVDGAIFAAYAWNGDGNAWFPFVNISGTGIYTTQIPDTYTGILLARINPEGTDEDPWKNVWNQTDDIDFTTIADQMVFTITGWGEGENAKSTYAVSTALEAAKATLQRFVNVAKGLEIDTTDAEALLANDEATLEQVDAAVEALLGSLQQKAAGIVATVKAFFNQFDGKAAEALAPYIAAAEEALAGTDYVAMRTATTTLAAQCLVAGQTAMENVDSYLRKMEDETLNADLDALKLAIAAISDPNEILGLLPAIQKLKEDMTTAATAYMARVYTLISEGTAAGKDVSAVSTAFNNTFAVAANYQAGTATLVEMGYALYNLIKVVDAYKNAIVFPDNAIVFDFEAAAAAGENPGNKNGSAGNGQAFFGWENPEKTDSKRQDYKGYEWAEGSVLPEVCQVWRRSDRINGNVKDGGLYCPSDKEMAIDGLNAGDKVIIVYDAENATNKDIIWAIGDGTSEGGPGKVRATATIGGVEAVTGETTIASGAEIVINRVTPAENGSGYIVFKVKKGMVIKQIAVIPAEEPVVPSYYLVGTMTNWVDEGVKEEYKLTLNTEAGEGIEEYMITLDLTTADQFKIVKKDGETLTWYPSEGNNYGQNGEITEDGEYTVYFRPNGDGGADWFYGCIYVVIESPVTGINAVNFADQNVVIYNIKGQKVTKTQKGLYIINGKKVVLQ